MAEQSPRAAACSMQGAHPVIPRPEPIAATTRAPLGALRTPGRATRECHAYHHSKSVAPPPPTVTPKEQSVRPTSPLLRWLAAAATLLLVAGGGTAVAAAVGRPAPVHEVDRVLSLPETPG